MSKPSPEAMAYFEGKTIFVAPYCHPDYSWTHTRNWHISRYTLVLNEVADLLDRYPEYRYYVDCYASFIEPVFERCPQLAARFQKFIDEGRFEVCGTYSNIRPNMVESEAFIRNMQIGRARFADVWDGLDIQVYADTCDVCASHSQLPQLLQKGGYRYLRFLRPSEVFTKKNIPWEHIYRGQDGSEVIATLASICGFFMYERVKPCFDEDIGRSVNALYENEFQYEAPRFQVPYILKGFGVDDVRPMRCWDSPEYFPFPEQMKKWQDEGIDIRFATPIDYFRALESVRDQLYLLKEPADIADVSFNVCLGGEQSLIEKRLKGARELVAAETIGAIGETLGLGEAPDYTHSWEENLFVSAHACQWAYEEDSADLHRRADRVIDRAVLDRQTVCRRLTRRMPFDLRTTAVVFNPHDKAVRRAVQLIITTPDPAAVRLEDGEGRTLPFQTLGRYGNRGIWEWDFLVAIDLPACGYNHIRVAQGCVDATERYEGALPAAPERQPLGDQPVTMENDVLSLRFEKGQLLEVIDKRTGRRLRGHAPFNGIKFHEFGDIDIGAPVKNIAEIHNAVFSEYMLAEEGPVRYRIHLYGHSGPHPVEQIISLVDGCAEVDFETHVDWQPCEGFMMVSVPCEDVTSLYGGIPFGTEDRRVDLEMYDKTKGKELHDPIGTAHRTIGGLFYAKDFAGYTMEGLPLALVAKTGDRYFLYDQDTQEMGHIVNLTAGISYDWMERINKTAFTSNGPHTFRYTLIVGEIGDDRARMQQLAEGLRQTPAIVRPICGPAQEQTLPAAGSFLSVAEETVRVSAFYRDAGETVLRIWEAAGKETVAHVALPADFAQVTATDFLSNPDPAVTPHLDGRSLTVTVRPHEILTLRLRG